jgi:prophage regulatory protein
MGLTGVNPMASLEGIVREQITRELYKILNVQKFGEQIIAERLKDAILKLGAVSEITGVPASSVYRKVQRGEFPAPVKLGETASGWLLSEVEAWIAKRREERDKELARQERGPPDSPAGPA